MSVFKQYSDAVFTKLKFLEGLRTVAEGMISSLPEELLEDLKDDLKDRDPKELMNLILAEYEAEFEAYRETHEETIREIYTEEQVQILLDIQTRHPWIREKAIAQLKLTFEKDQGHNRRLSVKIQEVIEDFFEEE